MVAQYLQYNYKNSCVRFVVGILTIAIVHFVLISRITFILYDLLLLFFLIFFHVLSIQLSLLSLFRRRITFFFFFIFFNVTLLKLLFHLLSYYHHRLLLHHYHHFLFVFILIGSIPPFRVDRISTLQFHSR